MATWNERPGSSAGLARGRQGRWLGGVCVGLAAASGRHVGWIRVAFVLAALVGGLGAALYLACWLIVPVQGAGEEEERSRPAGVVVLAQAWGAATTPLSPPAPCAVAKVF